MQTYLFYDTETTGLSESFDQILHFAAIRTDLNLKELERYELKIRLNPDAVPSPQAMITHRMNFKEVTEGISEYDAIKKIHRWVNQPGTISLGYNTLDFDDIFLRFGFYRNLLSPYTHQFKNNCSRLDLYPMAVMYFLFKNKNITWPEINGKTSLKLDALNTANQFVSGRSHHAMVDVEVTLALARCFFKDQEMWQHLLGYFNKQEDEKRVQSLQKEAVLMVRSKFGAEQRYQCPVLFLGNRPHYKQLLWLRLDSETLSQTTIENFPEANFILRKKFGEPPFILPPRFLEQLKPERLVVAEKNKKWLQQNTSLLEKIITYQTQYRYPHHPTADVDSNLYIDGFWSTEEENFCRAFHAATPNEKARLAEKIKIPRVQQLATRLLGRHFPENLTPAQAEQFADYMKKVQTADEAEALIDYQDKKRLTPTVALADLLALRKTALDDEQIEILNQLAAYLVR